MKILNEMEIKLRALSQNEGVARTCVAAFCLELNPTIDEITDIKTAVSEAITNCVVHAYPAGTGDIWIKVMLSDNCINIKIKDTGVGIDNLEKAREPFFTTKPDQERSGMGFTVMESFMDEINVIKNTGSGITVELIKFIGKENKTRQAGECLAGT